MEEKKLGLGSVVSTSVGLVIATSCLVSLGQGAGEVGIVFIGAMIVACLLNLTTIGSLSELNAYDQPVIDYLSSFPITKTVIDNIIAYLDIYIPELQKTKRGNYVIGIACSGGQHRSTYVARALATHYQERYKVILKHKDSPSLNLRKL